MKYRTTRLTNTDTANQLALGFSKRQTFYLDDITQIQLNIERSQQHLELEDELEDDLER